MSSRSLPDLATDTDLAARMSQAFAKEGQRVAAAAAREHAAAVVSECIEPGHVFLASDGALGC